MTKVKRLTVSNLKSVSHQTADFKGCTAIITGRNNAGKTSFLRSLFDRVRGIKPEQVLKQGETDGFAECELTTGEKLRWEFNDKGKEKLIFITEKEIKTSLNVELRNKYLPETFDVDKFLLSQPKQQRKTLQELVGLDFTDIDTRYDAAYKNRTLFNSKYNDAKTIFDATPVPEKAETISLDSLMLEKGAIKNKLNALYVSNKKVNEDARQKHAEAVAEYTGKMHDWEIEQNKRDGLIAKVNSIITELQIIGYKGNDVADFLASLPASEASHSFIEPIEPEYPEPMPPATELEEVDAKIEAANANNLNALTYSGWLKQEDLLQESKQQAQDANVSLSAIETERMELIKTAKMPEGFAFSDEGITYNGLAFTRQQLSSSGVYIAALKLAAMTLGEVKTLHFDASFLDKVSLAEIEKWAASHDLQLLIERPDFEAGDIQYELIENITQ